MPHVIEAHNTIVQFAHTVKHNRMKKNMFKSNKATARHDCLFLYYFELRFDLVLWNKMFVELFKSYMTAHWSKWEVIIHIVGS